jgi:hypothetical protein
VGAPDCPLVSIPIEKKGVEMPGSAPQLLPVRIKIKHTRITEAVQRGFKRLPAVKARRKVGQHPVPSTVGFLIVCLKLWISTFYPNFLTAFCWKQWPMGLMQPIYAAVDDVTDFSWPI